MHRGISAPEQLRLLLPRLTPEVFLLADNALSHPQEIAGYLLALASLPRFEHMIIPIGKGLSITYRSQGIGSLAAYGRTSPLTHSAGRISPGEFRKG